MLYGVPEGGDDSDNYSQAMHMREYVKVITSNISI